ncbi:MULTISPECIES: CopG family transcriptional regulator [Corynebacterium]|uniref:CopG family transcriptional regulator n=1 Tax=Corynebacterium flavescens TaxID=28028 RepID=A0A1L7CIT3_CORFL|nr:MULTISPECIES: CopG family transcriptional regulator [Corynebacterium]APT85762.1 CopG family transcriptional regulator [Corynebacterium flavescens]KAA8719588.1 CopG family transcriptional regulator [Corynebacterium flavescens]MDN6099935.1 CopG family transcriptional regulator [Corynebacterium flavescens]MDN6200256.1 CopG family transcriptional regulator [Corynebacterium flavescens]MDN6236695.1 CopG family transcriptional regulator [Corynebacterium flavescens]
MAMTLRLTPDQDHALTLLASAQGTSKHEAAIRAIVSAAARTLADGAVQDTARRLLPGRAELEAEIRRARS